VRAAAWLLLLVCMGCAPREGPLRLVAEDPRLEGLGWLAGSWAGVVDGGRVEEHWTVPAGGSMLGMNRTVVGGRTLVFEYLRIEVRGEEVVYVASPAGRTPATPFTLTALGDRRVVFENPDHDFPQRIVYARDGASLDARIEGMRDGEPEAMQWTMLQATIATLDE
jgi:hypothetical protein